MRIDGYYDEKGNVYLIEANYDKTLEKIDRVLEYAKEIGLKVPEKNKIRIEVLRGERYNRMMCVEFQSPEIPKTELTFLSEKSPLWDWLGY